MDYKNGKIYKLQHNDGSFYIGSTVTDLRKRLSRHKYASIKNTNQRVYKHINGEWKNVRIILIENYPCECKEDLVKKEDEHITKHIENKLCLNINQAVSFKRIEKEKNIKINGNINMETSLVTKKNYRVIIDSIRTGLNKEEGLDFLLNFTNVSNWLETNPTKKTKKPLTKSSLKTYYVGIKSTLRDFKDSRFEDVMKLYDAKIVELAAELTKQEEKQELSTAEKDKWLCWSCIIQTRDELLEDYKKDFNWKTYQDFVILCLYTMMPPERLDYSPMKFVKEMPTDITNNYCVLTDMKATFILNNYKTSKSKGIAVYDAPEELIRVLHQWRKINTSEWLLVKKTALTQPLSSHELGQIIQRVLGRKTGKFATLNIIRHSFITNMREGEMPLLEKKRLADRMGHSLVQAEKYIRINAV